MRGTSRIKQSLLLVWTLLGLLVLPAQSQELEKAEQLNDRAFELYQQAKFDEAVTLAEEALRLREQAYGPNHPATAQSLNMLAGILGAKGENRRALPLYERALSIFEEHLGDDSPKLTTSLNNLARCLLALNRSEEASTYLTRSLQNQQSSVGDSHPSLAGTLSSLAGLYRKNKKLDQAEEHYLRALECLTGEPESKREYILSGLGLTYLDGDQLEQALTAFEQALQVHEKHGNQDLSWRSAHLYNLAKVHKEMGQSQRALPYAERAVRIWTEIKTPNDRQLAGGLLLLGSIYFELDQLDSSWDICQRLMDIYDQGTGSYSRQSVKVMGRMASILRRQGKLEEAQAMASQAVELVMKSEDADTLHAANALTTKALICQTEGDYRSAMDLFQLAHRIATEDAGAHDRTTISILSHQTLLLQQMEDFEKALVVSEQVLQLVEATYGPNHPKLASSLASTAVSYERLGKREEAMPLLKRALAIREESLGPQNEATVSLQVLLADFYSSAERFDESEELYRKAIAVWRENGNDTMEALGLSRLSALLRKTGRLEDCLALESRALEIRLRMLGEAHPNTSSSLRKLAALNLEMGNRKEALSLARRAEEGRLATTTNIFSYTSARQRLQYQNTLHPHCLFASLGSGPDIADSVLRYKGLVLDSQVEDLRDALAHSDPAVRELAAEMRDLKLEITRLTLSSTQDLESMNEEERLRRRLELLESRLAKSRGQESSSRRALRTTTAQVLAALPPKTALVEFVRYHHHSVGGEAKESRYGAVLIQAGTDPLWLPLSRSAEELEATVAEYRQLVLGPEADRLFHLDTGASQIAGGPIKPVLDELYQAVWEPIEKKLEPGIETIVISPDGPLNFVSFATLLKPDATFLAESHDLVYVSSGRDLLAASSASANERVVLVGNPDFGTQAGPAEAQPSVDEEESRAWGGVQFQPLPFAETECRELDRLFQEGEGKVELVLGPQATEEFVRSVESPSVLHLATHGYFLPDQNFESYRSKYAQGAMYRNGLALAGAQSTVQNYRNGIAVLPDNDGLLTAAEVSAMNLQGTRLVTLSACNTGSGAAQTGEGVMGLRRGFVLAGARNLVFSLWPVADRETSAFMQDFYARADSQAAPLAMAQAQRDWLVRLRKEKSLGEAVRLAGPFVLTFQGEME